MKKYKIIVSYDGTDYYGWQMQPDQPSIQQTLQDTFAAIFDRKISILGASRTDAGVHALGQVATFKTDVTVSEIKMMYAWNNSLPDDIVIRSLEEVYEHFHSQYDVAQKTYWYHFTFERPVPFLQRYGWHVLYPVDLEKLQQCLAVFVGTHDFRSFATGEDMGRFCIKNPCSQSAATRIFW